MKRFAPLAMIVTLLFIASTAHALPKQGNFDLSGSLNAAYLEDAKNPIDLGARIAVFYTDPLSFGVSTSFSVSGKDRVYGTMVDARYHFYVDEKIVPYAGIQAGFALVDIDDDNDFALGFGGHAGLAYYLQPNLSVFAQLFNTIYFAHGTTSHRGIGLGCSYLF